MSTERLRATLLIGAALAVAASGMARTFGGPFERGWLGHNGARYSQIGRNYARLGFVATRAMPVLDPAERFGEGPPDVYSHHPPGLSLVLGLAFAIAGVDEDVARAVPAVATLAALLVLAALVGGAGGRRAGAFAAVAAAGLPMVSIYGAHVDVQGSPVMLGSLLVVLAYARWCGGHGRLSVVLGAAAVASAFDWYALYFPVLCGIHAWATRRRGAGAALVATGLLLFGAWFAWALALPESYAGTLGRAVGVRLASSLGDDGGAALGRHAAAWWHDTRLLMPAWPLLLAVAAAVATGRLAVRRAEGAALGPAALVALLTAAPVLHAVLFPAGLLMHSYWLFGLPMGLGAALGLALARLRDGAAYVGLAAIVGAGWFAAPEILAVRDGLPAAVGAALAARTEPGDAILTDYDVNPFVPGRDDDAYLLTLPEVTFYADRRVRGRVESVAPGSIGLTEARRRLPDARWFLDLPWWGAPGRAAALESAGAGSPLVFPEDERVRLYPLTPHDG